jgi:DNA-binding MarR family transcriptional regulator
MKIEEEIRQRTFKNEYHRLLINLIYTANGLNLKGTCRLRAYGITMEQFNVLRILRGQYPGPSTVNLVAERMLDKNSNASRLIEKLRLKGLVERTTCPEDRRAVNIIITGEGLVLLEKTDKEEEKWLSELKSLDEQEARQLNYLLDKLRN